jgi:hypothetical protein
VGGDVFWKIVYVYGQGIIWSEFHCFSHTFGGGDDDLGTFVSNAKAWPWANMMIWL